MTTDTADSGAVRCTACRELIQPGATVCPHCGTGQGPARWSLISAALKWTGGIVTVVSLVVGVISLSSYYRDWREQRTAVAELVGAAAWLVQTGNYQQAWSTYRSALELKPADPTARRGQFELTLRWLRDFYHGGDDLDGLLDRITGVLYQGLARAQGDDVATILAHVGWVQVIRAEADLPLRLSPDDAFAQALEREPRNVYANAMSAYWRLWRDYIDVDDVAAAEERFNVALETDRERAFVRRLQLSRLGAHGTFGKSDETARAVLAALIRASHSMMESDEPSPVRDHRIRTLDAYGFMGRAEFVEDVIDVLPPEAHLAVHDWLLEGLDYGSGRPLYATQTSYIRARLTEASGDRDGALALYEALLASDETSAQLDELVNAGIERLTGRMPERAFARDYFNDPVDESEPWRFHSDTLVHFDPLWLPRNFDEALEFFRERIAADDPRLPELVGVLPRQIDRVAALVREGDERQRSSAYTLAFSAGHHQSARFNLVRLHVLQGDALAALGQFDRAIAVLTDIDNIARALDEDWTDERAWIAFRLARAHALRAAGGGGPEDVAIAVEKLDSVVTSSAVDGEIASWTEITGDDFAALRSDPGYQRIIRGRQR